MKDKMDLNSVRKKKSTKPYGNCPSAILNAVPDKYKKIAFTELSSFENFADKAIIGKIVHLYPVGKRVNGFVRKILIIDGLEKPSDDQKKLVVFLLDQFAQDSEAAELEGYIVVANLSVEKSTHQKEDEFPFQILVKSHDSEVWFGTKKKTSEHPKVKKKGKKLKKEKVEDPQFPKILSNHYEYVALGELQESESQKFKYNVYGIVEKCDLKVRQASGAQTQVLELVLTDKTDKTEKGFPCLIFCAADEIFPDIYPGDIVRIHRMIVSKFRNQLRGKCPSSKFILVFSQSNNGTKPKTVAKSFTFTPEDAIMVKELFDWYDKKNQPKLISEIERGDFVNIICQVIGVFISKIKGVVILKIWDGTKSNIIESSHFGLREEKLDEKLFSIAKNFYVTLAVYGDHCSSAGELKPGQFVQVCNASVYSPKDNPDDCKLCLFSGNKEKRGIQALNLDDSRLIELKDRLEKIITEEQELGNQTEDVLNQNNSIFINCDISTLQHSSQKSCINEEDVANIDALNKPMSQRISKNDEVELNVVSSVEAAVKPGQSTQEFGEALQKEYQFVKATQENDLPAFTESDPLLNKTPVDSRMLLHNPPSQPTTSNLLPPFTNDTPEDWWNSLSTISVADGHSNMKQSSLAEVIKHEVPYKFRLFCIARSYKPTVKSIQQLIHLYCPICTLITDDLHPSFEPYQEQEGVKYFYCPECSENPDNQKKSTLEYVYLFSLDLHDGPASIEVLVFGENAMKFLKGIPPEEVLRNSVIAESLLQTFWNICPSCRPLNSSESLVNNSSTNHPILDCCIMSYTVSNSVCYQMFDTILL